MNNYLLFFSAPLRLCDLKTNNMKNVIFILSIIITSSLNSFSQCYPDRHNSTWFDGWVSCEASESPNPERGVSHWIMYDFNHIYGLGDVHLWNTNDGNNLDWGLQMAAIDYSIDGINWIELGEYTFEMASGESIYQGFSAADFDDQEARFVLITALENWGGDCYGLAEIKFEVTNPVAIAEVPVIEMIDITTYPNPFNSEFTLSIKTTNAETVTYSLSDTYGRTILSGEIETPLRENKLMINGNNLTNGIYHLVVNQDNKLKRISVVKVN